MTFRRVLNLICAFAFAAASFATSSAMASTVVQVTITNQSPTGGVYITPLWAGFHDGSFDSYNGGLSSQPGVERVAEDGDVSQISSDFLGGYTYIDNTGASATVLSSQSGADRVDGAIANGAPIAPGEVASSTFNVDVSGANRYFSYASMILPSSDYWIGNGSPTAHDLSSLAGAAAGTSISFDIGLPGEVNDAGTEVNDFATSPGNPLFGIPAGQSAPDQGVDENGVNVNVLTPYSDFLNTPDNFLSDLSELKFNNSALYPNGVANVTITVVPEPASASLLVFALPLLGLLRRRR